MNTGRRCKSCRGTVNPRLCNALAVSQTSSAVSPSVKQSLSTPSKRRMCFDHSFTGQVPVRARTVPLIMAPNSNCCMCSWNQHVRLLGIIACIRVLPNPHTVRACLILHTRDCCAAVHGLACSTRTHPTGQHADKLRHCILTVHAWSATYVPHVLQYCSEDAAACRSTSEDTMHA